MKISILDVTPCRLVIIFYFSKATNAI